MEGEMLHIVQHVKRLAANIRCPTSLLQEEQERELEAELEEERRDRCVISNATRSPPWPGIQAVAARAVGLGQTGGVIHGGS